MLAIALGLKAVHAGYRVYYTTAADLVARTSRAALEGRWQTTMRFWNGPQLLVDRRARLPADARRSRRAALPGHQPALRTRLDHPHHQPRHRQLGRNLRRQHRRRRDPRPPPAPRHRPTDRRRQLPHAQPPRPPRRPSAPASTTPPRVGNSHDRNWGTLTIVDTPIHASWLNQIEACFSILQRKAPPPPTSQISTRLRPASPRSRTTTARSPSRLTGRSPAPDLDRVLPRSPTANPPAARGLTIRTSGRSTSCGASGGS